MHDDDLKRTTNGHGKINKYTLDEVSALKIDNGANIENYTDLRSPHSKKLWLCSTNTIPM